MILKRSEILINYSIPYNTLRQMVRWGDAKPIKRGYYEIEDSFLSSFSLESYAQLVAHRISENIKSRLQSMLEEKKSLRLQKLRVSQKIAQNRPEVKQRKSSSSLAFWKDNQSAREHQSEVVTLGWSKKSSEELQQWSSDCSDRAKRAYANMPDDKKQLHDANVSLGVKAANKKKRDSGYYETDEWKSKAKETQKKIYKTKKANGTFNTSKSSEESKQKLRDLGFTIEEEKPYPNEGNLHCDAYVKELDLWIEFHYSHLHSYEPFNETNEDHLKEIQKLKHKSDLLKNGKETKTQYDIMIYTWTDLDVRKRNNAQRHQLNYLCFYSPEDFEQWLITLK